MRVVLISTDINRVAIGVKTLSACLIEHGFETVVIIIPGDNYEKIHMDDIYDLCKDIAFIGISCMTLGVSKAIGLKQSLEKKISAPIVIGGIHASLDPESLIPYFDLVCHGEGEDVIVKLAERISKNARYDDIPGLWIRNGDTVIKNNNIPLKRDLNEYPIPDYDLSHQFIIEKTRLVQMLPIPFHISIEDFTILGSRGCPHHCTYCCNQRIQGEFPWRKAVIHYSVDYLINHIKTVSKIYPEVRSFWIEDDTFFAKKLEDIEEFAIRFKKDINKPFQILISPWTYSDEKMKPLIDAGMNKLIMGIQSGSENVTMNIYDRRITNQRILKIINSLHQYSIVTCYDFIGMSPFETQDDLVETIRFIRNIPTPFYIFMNSLAFYPKTELYERAIREGLDVSKRIHHGDSNLGYAILKDENIQHKIFHFIHLLMAGHSNSLRIGKIPRILMSEIFIIFYKLINNKLSDGIITAICSLLAYINWRNTIKNLLGPKLFNKVKYISYTLKDFKKKLS
jgi:radical SAM superfamily enzyme YgiQ (UPF0313 family)